MPRFFISPEEAAADRITLTGEAARHILSSLRMRVGERLTLCDGQGTDLLTELCEAGRQQVTVQVLSRTPSTAESSCRITLFQCLPKGDKMESIVQKAVELGAVCVQPVLSSRCISRPDERAAEKKRLRWQQIADEAAKQSGRGALCAVRPTLSWREAVASLASLSHPLMLYENQQDSPLSRLPQGAAEVGILVGPEGGFSPEEAEEAARAGIVLIGLGPRILRTETAGPAAIAVVQYLTGNLG